MNAHDEERMKKLLQQALPHIEVELETDLWPSMLRRLDAAPAMPPWFDWALLGGLAALAAFFPTAIPVFLYYL